MGWYDVSLFLGYYEPFLGLEVYSHKVGQLGKRGFV